jgi:hypothetical protein
MSTDKNFQTAENGNAPDRILIHDFYFKSQICDFRFSLPIRPRPFAIISGCTKQKEPRLKSRPLLFPCSEITEPAR